MLIIRRMNCIDAASGIVLSVSGSLVHWLGDAQSTKHKDLPQHVLVHTETIIRGPETVPN